MLAELVFLSRFVGLTYGERPVVLRADPQVQRVELRRDGVRFATLTRPPWAVNVDFGPELGPYELTAVGFGADGSEVARDTQFLNLARPSAEALILLDRKDGALTARLVWLHINGTKPSSAVLKFDGQVVSRKATAVPVPLGPVADDKLHVVSAELQFPDGSSARKEVVFGGGFSEQMPAELTAIAVRQRAPTPPAEARCLVAGGKEIAPVAVERREAHVSFIVNGGTPAWVHLPRRGMSLADARLQVVTPVLRTGEGADYFPIDGVPRHLGLRDAVRSHGIQGRKQFAEAIAASGMLALRIEQRRAVVYVLGKGEEKDHSGVHPAAVRRYLKRIGVPLHVWSFTGPRPDLEATWGEVEDVSSSEKLLDAATRLRDELETQRIAWLPAPPLDAYRVTARAGCAYEPLVTPPPAKGASF